MGMDSGVAGAFGLLLSKYDWLDVTVSDMRKYIEKKQNKYGAMSDEIICKNFFQEKWKPKLISTFGDHGIHVPSLCGIYDTGTEADRIARCDTDAGDFVLGFGMLTDPWHWHEVLDVGHWDESFRKEARFHTWVWVG